VKSRTAIEVLFLYFNVVMVLTNDPYEIHQSIAVLLKKKHYDEIRVVLDQHA
jgi:hypothetical protein